jgi:hypothetical protein
MNIQFKHNIQLLLENQKNLEKSFTANCEHLIKVMKLKDYTSVDMGGIEI